METTTKNEITFSDDQLTTSKNDPSVTLTPGKFLKVVAIASIIVIGLLVVSNVWIDIYGLFRPVKDRALPVYYNERVSKYLLSHHYIPENFNAAIVGTSLSANLEVTEFNVRQDKIHIYNASLMGANVSELRPVVDNLIAGGIRKMIICFSPYMIKNSGSKEIEFGPKLYYGAFGSKNLYETYLVGAIRKYNLMPNKFPHNQIDEFGVNHFGRLYKVKNVKAMIDKVVKADPELAIDQKALQELKELIAVLKKNNINFVGYFHPVPAEVLASKAKGYDRFQSAVREFVGDDNRLVNFNTKGFSSFSEDYSNYIDHGHLSEKGQKVIFDSLSVRLSHL